MSAKVETLATPVRHVASYVLAIILALAIGATAGSVITEAFGADATTTTRERVVGIAPWDQQMLDSMTGRQQAETVGHWTELRAERVGRAAHVPADAAGRDTRQNDAGLPGVTHRRVDAVEAPQGEEVGDRTAADPDEVARTESLLGNG